MKSPLLILSMVFIVGMYSCHSYEKTGEQSLMQIAAEEPTADSIVRDTLTNSQGIQLAMTYDNARHTATFVLEGKEIRYGGFGNKIQ
jgi:hypothetical protein